MTTLVLTVIGDDQSGLVDALSGVVTRHGGSWDRSHLARLGGKFAGIVVVEIPDARARGLIDDLEPLEAHGLFEIVVERTTGDEPTDESTALALQLVGQDRPGIVHEISHALAVHGVSIEELETQSMSAPMAGEVLFMANAVLRAPAGVPLDDLRDVLEALAQELMVDIDLTPEH
ncbi:MAG: glycine cleavage system protein R [Ilumatobacteraceae bacterium]